MHKTVTLNQIKPNPFRDMKRHLIDQTKIEALEESINTTGFWGNVVARPDNNGAYELAYGHHRVVAARNVLGKNAEVTIIIKKLSDKLMLQMMARENAQEYQSSPYIDIETLRQTVLAYANGKIDKCDLEPKKKDKAQDRFAPSFIQGQSTPPDPGAFRYSASSTARFLGWPTKKSGESQRAQTLLNALELIERGGVTDEHFKGLSMEQVIEVVRLAMQERRLRESAAEENEKRAEDAEVRGNTKVAQRLRQDAKVARKAATKVSSDTVKRVTSKARAGQIATSEIKTESASPALKKKRAGNRNEINVVVDRYAKVIRTFLDKETKRTKNLFTLAEFKEDMTASSRKRLVASLRLLVKRANEIAAKFELKELGGES